MSEAAKLWFARYLPPKGLTPEELEEHRRRIKEEDDLMNRERHELYNFDYISKFEERNVCEDKIPRFIKNIFKIHALLKEEGEIFIDQFCMNYLEDQNFRDQYEGKYIFIEDGRFSFVNSIGDVNLDSNSSKTFVKIGKQNPPINGYGRFL